MTQQQSINQIKEKALPILKNAGVTKSALFGSYVHGDSHENSDVDILVEFPKEKSLFDFIGLKLRLEEILEKKVDLVEYDTIKPLLRESILGSQVSLL